MEYFLPFECFPSKHCQKGVHIAKYFALQMVFFLSHLNIAIFFAISTFDRVKIEAPVGQRLLKWTEKLTSDLCKFYSLTLPLLTPQIKQTKRKKVPGTFVLLFELMVVVWMLEQLASGPNHTSYNKCYFNEFVANVLRDNIESKKNQPPASEKKNEDIFQF